MQTAESGYYAMQKVEDRMTENSSVQKWKQNLIPQMEAGNRGFTEELAFREYQEINKFGYLMKIGVELS